jgi:hypothetical protein
MSRIALFACASLVLLGSVVPALAAPPSEPNRRGAPPPPAVRLTAKPVPAARPIARPVVRPYVRPSLRNAAPVRPAQVAPQASSRTAAKVIAPKPVPTTSKSPKPQPRPQVVAKPQSVAKTPVAKTPVAKTPVAKTPVKPAVTKPEIKQAAVARRNTPPFDRSTRSSLLPAGSPQLLSLKGPQALPPAKSSAVKKIAGAAVGAAVIGGGLAALSKPSAASAVAAGPVRPAARLPLANLNHPHIKPVARVLPSIIGHKHANRPRLPLLVLAPALLGASWMGREFYVWNRRSYDNVGWIAPIPSCYVGGTVFYRNPWSGDCFNFETAEPGERFAVGMKVYTWTPARYPSVEDMVDDQDRNGASIMNEPFRIAHPTEPARRVAAEASSRSAFTAAPAVSSGLEATDCSSCLAAIGPVEVTGGQCSVTISNNCALPVAFDIEFQRNDQTFCQTKLDAAGGSEVIVCTQPCTTFLESRVNLKSAMPKLATSTPFKGCRPHWAALEEQVR